jgi:hypothetical protein
VCIKRVLGPAKCLAVAATLWPHNACPANPISADQIAQALAPDDLDARMAVYQRQLEEYTRARAAFEEAASAYWTAIAEKRRVRNSKRRDQGIVLEDYVLTQPPLYSGPRKPVDPSAPALELPPRKPVPVVADFLQAAAEHFGFVPQQPASELDFKRAYAQVAAAAGLTKEQIVRIYAFEAGGNGGYDVQAGLEYPGPNARAISSALGYNQLLTTNSVGLMAEKGDRFVKALRTKAARLIGPAKEMLEKKVAIVQTMVDFTRTVADSWSEHERLANTPKGLGVHAVLLDIDVGPLLQTQKLLDSVQFAKRKGIVRPLTAAELEMMNLTGDANGLDMILMPAAIRDYVPTSNFFQRSGYERNAIAIRNSVVAKLLAATDAKMDREAQLQGARDLAAAYPN